jgi:hypothetical protein
LNAVALDNVVKKLWYHGGFEKRLKQSNNKVLVIVDKEEFGFKSVSLTKQVDNKLDSRALLWLVGERIRHMQYHINFKLRCMHWMRRNVSAARLGGQLQQSEQMHKENKILKLT